MKSSKNVLTNNLSQYFLSDEQMDLLKKTELSIFDDIYKACKKRNIPFYLMHGTMLGAVRHKGFIPWDDDIDTVAYIEDFDKIKHAIIDDYPNKYEFAGIFENYNTNPFFALLHLTHIQCYQNHYIISCNNLCQIHSKPDLYVSMQLFLLLLRIRTHKDWYLDKSNYSAHH